MTIAASVQRSAWASAAALAACGSSDSPSSAAGTGSGDTLALKFADCMRSHEVPNFPDPGSNGSDPGVNPAISQQSPAFQSASQACIKLAAGRPRPDGTGLRAEERSVPWQSEVSASESRPLL
jgi:hypothetical protein